MSPLAEAAFGAYNLEVPEGINIEDVHDFEAPGNELGYVARLSPNRVSGLARRFVRADVNVVAKDDTNPGLIPESDVDRVLREAETRVESDFFLQSTITKAGLGAWVPYVDFDIGDIVNVQIFGIWVKLPVTRIEPVITDGDVEDWNVHVGGQLLSDDQAREVENATIHKSLIQDRRELAGLDAAATQAVKDASEAKSTANDALQATDDNRTYIDQKIQEAYDSIELGRGYLESMQKHLAAGAASSTLATQFAAEASQYALRAEQILNNLDPLRDDVVAIHQQVEQLGQDAASYAVQAAQAVTDAAAHVTAAEAAANAADAHAEAGRLHVVAAEAAADRGQGYVSAAEDSATAAHNSAQAAQSLVNDAEGILSSTRAARDAAQSSLDDARGLLNSVPGDGRSLVQILAAVVSLHQDTLESHGDILDAHAEVLAKHGEAIAYAASAASQAALSAQYAMDAANEALEAARHAALAADDALKTGQDAAKAASEAAKAAGEASKAADNNAQAIGKLQQADQKLIEADQKLQAQIDILEDSQRALIQATSLLASGVAHAAAAVQSALMASDDAGKAAGSALDASASNTSAIDTLVDTIIARDAAIQAWQAADDIAEAEQSDLFDQLRESQQEIVSRMNGQLNQIMATKAGTTWPGVNTFTTRTGYWGINLPDSNNSIIYVSWWKMGANGALTPVLEKTASPAPSFGVEAQDNELVKASWGAVAAAQITIAKTQAAITVGTSTTVLPGLTQVSAKKATQGYLRAKVTWNAANRGSTYRIMIFVNGVEVARKSTSNLGPLSFLGDGERSQSVTASGVTVPAGASVQVRAYCSNSGSSQRRIKSASLDGTWIETQ